jgi:hypothetical protein
MPSLHPAALEPVRLLADCDVTRTRRGGPGGQHRNKVETAVVIAHRPTGVHGEAAERRSQADNQRMAIFRLRVNLALKVRSHHPAKSNPSQQWQSRVQGGRISVNSSHDDFPALLAEALDRIAEQQFDLKAASQSLQCTASQLAKFLKQEPRALAIVNGERTKLGLRSLK